MVGTLVLGLPILSLFGPRYTNAFDSLLLMVFASPVILLTSVYTTDLRVGKRVRPIFYITAISSAFTLLAAYLLLPSMGIVGAAIGFVAGRGVAPPPYMLGKGPAGPAPPCRGGASLVARPRTSAVPTRGRSRAGLFSRAWLPLP